MNENSAAEPKGKLHFGLWLILSGYVALGVIYTLVTPPLEASDEYKHFPVVQYIQTEHALPVLDPIDPGLWLQEGAQPPLYYALMALATSWVDTRDLVDIHQTNPHAFVGDPNQVFNKNLIIHEPDREQFPGRGSILAIYSIRLLGVVLGMGTIILTFRLATLLLSPQVGLLAAALTAFNPMFLFVSAAVNNDVLAILLGHLGLLLLVLIWREQPDPRTQWYRYAQLGLVIGLGVLTKLSLGALLGLAAIAQAWLSWKGRDRRILVLGGSVVAVVMLLISGWWFVRNVRLYGDPTALNTFIAVQGNRAIPITWSGWIDEFGTFFRAYWGLFGGVNIAAPNVFYTVYNLLLLFGLVGMMRFMWRNRRRPSSGFWLLLAWAIILFTLLIRWNFISPSFQGRLIFPALGAVNIVWATGLLAWAESTWRPRLVGAMAILMFTASALLPWITIRPAYAFPQPLPQVPDAYIFGPFDFAAGNGIIQLVGVQMASGQTVAPGGGPVEVALYWRALSTVGEAYVSSVHALGRGFQSVGQIDRYPAAGMVPTSRWRAGDVYRDVYHIYIDEEAVAPARLRLAVSLFDDSAGKTLAMRGPDGNAVELLLVGEAIRLAAASTATVTVPESPIEVDFDEGITLAGYDLFPLVPVSGNDVQLTLYWQASGQPGKDYTVFVHLLDSAQTWLSGADSPPVANDFPTSLWRAGDRVDDLHRLSVPADLPANNYQIKVGLYDPVTGARLSRLDGFGDSVDIDITVKQ